MFSYKSYILVYNGKPISSSNIDLISDYDESLARYVTVQQNSDGTYSLYRAGNYRIRSNVQIYDLTSEERTKVL